MSAGAGNDSIFVASSALNTSDSIDGGAGTDTLTLTGGGTEIEIIAFVLDIIDHPDYDKKFGYRGR